jgi:ribosome-binding protein aMBF1 (putative translation factor)
MVAQHETDDRRRAAIQRARTKLAGRLSEAQGRSSLAVLRLRKGLSQTQLADLMGLKQPQIAKLERGGIANAGAPTIKKLRDALGVTADEILDSDYTYDRTGSRAD